MTNSFRMLWPVYSIDAWMFADSLAILRHIALEHSFALLSTAC